MTKVTLWNNSGKNGGACTVTRWHVILANGQGKTDTQHNLYAGQSQSFDLTALGWDTTKTGDSFWVEADIEAGNQAVKSVVVPFQAGINTKWEVSGPSLAASIDGPI
jgi:hypothetical protein